MTNDGQMNALLAWYRLAQDKLGLRDSSMGGRQTGTNDPLMFAQQQMMNSQGSQPQMDEAPDFFGDSKNALRAYTPPASFDGSMPTRSRPVDPLRPQMRDYISRTLR